MKVAAAEQPKRPTIIKYSSAVTHHKNENAAQLKSHCACLIGICWPAFAMRLRLYAAQRV
jgi:hypothetical protein